MVTRPRFRSRRGGGDGHAHRDRLVNAVRAGHGAVKESLSIIDDAHAARSVRAESAHNDVARRIGSAARRIINEHGAAHRRAFDDQIETGIRQEQVKHEEERDDKEQKNRARERHRRHRVTRLLGRHPPSAEYDHPHRDHPPRPRPQPLRLHVTS